MIERQIKELGLKIEALRLVVASLKKENQQLRQALKAEQDHSQKLQAENRKVADKLLLWVEKFRSLTSEKSDNRGAS